MTDDDYRELTENARAALYDLLTASEPGTGLPLHHAYSMLKRMLQEPAEPAEAPRSTAHRGQRGRSSLEDIHARSEAWKVVPWAEKLHWVRNALGDDRLTLREMAKRIGDAHPECSVYDTSLLTLIKELLELGEVERVKESRKPGGSQYRWRYHRHVELDSNMAALERTLDEKSA